MFDECLWPRQGRAGAMAVRTATGALPLEGIQSKRNSGARPDHTKSRGNFQLAFACRLLCGRVRGTTSAACAYVGPTVSKEQAVEAIAACMARMPFKGAE